MTSKLKQELRSYFKDDSLFQSDYYLKDPNDNTLFGIKQPYWDMFYKGDGGELTEKDGEPAKSAAIHSSSMLAYNFFSWINESNPFIYEGVKYDKVVFEEHLRVLEYGTSDLIHFPKSTATANLDVVLAGTNEEGKTSLLFIESKFTEHLSNARSDLNNMVLSYSTPECFFDNGIAWASLVEAWKDRAKSILPKGYYNGIKQDICHLLAISNLIIGHTRDWFNKEGSTGDEGSWLKKIYSLSISGDEEIKFRNVIFSPSLRYKADAQDVKNYRSLYSLFEEDVKRIIPSSLEIGLVTYVDMWKSMLPCIKDLKLKNYLEERYISFQQETF